MGSTGGALIVTIAAMVIANVSTHLIFPGHGVIVAVCLLVVLVLIALWARLSWGELGLGRAGWARGMRWALWIMAGAFAVFVVALLLPFTRNLVNGPASGSPDPWVRVLLTIPLATVLVEELAFRGVRWALLRRRYTPRAATLGSAVLFGLWHVLSALGGGSANAAVDTVSGVGLLGSVVRIAGTVLFTGAAGVLFAELRYRSGSLIPSMALHWAVNGLGVAFVAIVLG